MKTLFTASELEKCAAILRSGGLVAVPTETVYGLAGNGLDAQAVEMIYEVKGRPSVKPLSLMVSGAEAMDEFAEEVPAAARVLAGKFWPGPLTIVLKAKKHIPPVVLAGGTTVGLRCPDHPLTLELLKISGVPFAAPSANPSSEPSPKNAEKVMEYFNGRIDAVLDGGECGLGRESTIISMAQTPYKILRRGALPEEEIADALIENMHTVGITGGSGTGKTTALNALAALGAYVIDCDALYHELLKTCAPMLEGIEAHFPGTVVSGELDRKALGALVFGSTEKLRELNSLTHPFVKDAVLHLLRAHAMSGGTFAAIDAAELISGGLSGLCDMTLAVTAPREDRLERVMKRDGITREYAEARINAQRTDEYYSSLCDRTVINNGSEAELKDKIYRIITEDKKWTI